VFLFGLLGVGAGLCFETVLLIPQAGLKLKILLFQPLKFWDLQVWVNMPWQGYSYNITYKTGKEIPTWHGQLLYDSFHDFLFFFFETLICCPGWLQTPNPPASAP
jgi:hypothetical protein